MLVLCMNIIPVTDWRPIDSDSDYTTTDHSRKGRREEEGKEGRKEEGKLQTGGPPSGTDHSGNRPFPTVGWAKTLLTHDWRPPMKMVGQWGGPAGGGPDPKADRPAGGQVTPYYRRALTQT